MNKKPVIPAAREKVTVFLLSMIITSVESAIKNAENQEKNQLKALYVVFIIKLENKKMVKIFTLLTVMVLAACSGGDFGDQKHTIKGVITEIGTCGGGEGFFSGNYECAVTVETKNGKEYWNVYGQVSKGQSIYKHCWVEDGVTNCFNTAYKYIRKQYRTKNT